jgi:hypothetical protein
LEVDQMRSFAGRDILLRRDFEHAEFMQVFEVARSMYPIAPMALTM